MKYAFLAVIAAMMIGCPKRAAQDVPAPTTEDAAVVQIEDAGATAEDATASDRVEVAPEG